MSSIKPKEGRYRYLLAKTFSPTAGM